MQNHEEAGQELQLIATSKIRVKKPDDLLEKHPVGGESAVWNTLVMREIREEWPDRTSLPKAGSLQWKIFVVSIKAFLNAQTQQTHQQDVPLYNTDTKRNG